MALVKSALHSFSFLLFLESEGRFKEKSFNQQMFFSVFSQILPSQKSADDQGFMGLNGVKCDWNMGTVGVITEL